MYDYSRCSDFDKSQLPEGYKGIVWSLSHNWKNLIPIPSGPIKYLEIGCMHGANICSMMKTFAHHPDSEIHAVDPWFMYKNYTFEDDTVTNYSNFINNIGKLAPKDLHKIYIHRGTSQKTLPTFSDESFDIIYIDGNHLKDYVLEDAVHSIRKLKSGGWLIFDDYHSEDVRNGIAGFMHCFNNHFEEPIVRPGVQLFMRKK